MDENSLILFHQYILSLLGDVITLHSCGAAPHHRKGNIMAPIDITRIEYEARRLRAEEMQRINGLISARLALYGQLMAASALTGLKALAEILLPLFSWNPQTASTPRSGPGLLNRLSRAGRALFSWNPQAHRS
jgi:hypothetical protein